jgi:hypothetical protein
METEPHEVFAFFLKILMVLGLGAIYLVLFLLWVGWWDKEDPGIVRIFSIIGAIAPGRFLS